MWRPKFMRRETPNGRNGVETLESAREAMGKTLISIRSCSAWAAAGGDVPLALRDFAQLLNVATANLLAVAERSTPQRVYSDLWKTAPLDDEWRAGAFEAMKARGARMMIEPGD